MPHRFFEKTALAICLGLACSGAVAVLPRVAEAKPPAGKSAKQPIGVGAISGPQGSKVRARVMKVLRDSGSYELTDVEDIKPGSSPKKYQSMASGIQADAIVVGTVSQSMNLTLAIYAANGTRIDDVSIKGGSGPKLLKAIDNELEIAIADPLARAHSGAGGAAAAAPAKAAGPTAEEAEEDEPKAAKGAGAAAAGKGAAKPSTGEEESEDSGAAPDEAASEASASSDDAASAASGEGGKGRRPVELMLGARFYNRNFDYTDPKYGPLVPYHLTIAPTVFVAARLYPFAFGSDGVLSNIGLMGRFELGIATSTKYQPTPGAPQVTLQTRAFEYQVGLRARLPIGAHEIGVFWQFGNQTFTLAGDENPKSSVYALVPDVHYNYIRAGLDMRFYISKLIVEAHVAPRFLTSLHEIDLQGVWFPGAVGSGLDAGAMLGWQIVPWLTAAAGFDFVRYGFDFNNLPETPPPRVIAGGATDTYLSGWAALLTTFGAGGGASVGSASAAASTTEATDESAKASEASDEEAEEPKKAAPPPKAKKQPATKQAAPAKKKAQPVEEEEEEE